MNIVFHALFYHNTLRTLIIFKEALLACLHGSVIRCFIRVFPCDQGKVVPAWPSFSPNKEVKQVIEERRVRQSAAHLPAPHCSWRVIFEAVSTNSPTYPHLLQPISLAVAGVCLLRAPLMHCIQNSHHFLQLRFPFFWPKYRLTLHCSFLTKL